MKRVVNGSWHPSRLRVAGALGRNRWISSHRLGSTSELSATSRAHATADPRPTRAGGPAEAARTVARQAKFETRQEHVAEGAWEDEGSRLSTPGLDHEF
jgi:hypothetical protein